MPQCQMFTLAFYITPYSEIIILAEVLNGGNDQVKKTHRLYILTKLAFTP